jgi:hypothetical protein
MARELLNHPPPRDGSLISVMEKVKPDERWIQARVSISMLHIEIRYRNAIIIRRGMGMGEP